MSMMRQSARPEEPKVCVRARGRVCVCVCVCVLKMNCSKYALYSVTLRCRIYGTN